MSIARLESGPGGKDVVLVAAPALLAAPSRVELPEPEPAPGLILPSGDINWGCPCLGGMATGPCAQPFRDAFSCFHYSEADPKGSDCYEKFSDMQGCMADYPELYGRDDEDEEPVLAGAGGDQRDRDQLNHDQRDRDQLNHDQRDRDQPERAPPPAKPAADPAKP